MGKPTVDLLGGKPGDSVEEAGLERRWLMGTGMQLERGEDF